MDILTLIQEEIKEYDQNILLSMTPIPSENRLNYRGCKNVMEIMVPINGKPTVLTVGFPEFFPKELPKFFDKSNQFNRIPHKEPDGFLCFSNTESMLIDERYPGAVLLSCLETVIELIEKGLSGANNDEYLVEFEAYWSRQSQTKTTYASINTENTQVRELDLWRVQVKSTFVLIATETHTDAVTIVKELFRVSLKEAEKFRCIYLPLKSGANITPPEYFRNWNLADMKANLLSNLDPLNKKRFHQLAAKKRKTPNTYDYVIAGLPIPSDNWALFGMEVYNPRASLTTNWKNRKIDSILLHPFVQAPPEYKTSPLVLKRWNQDYLLNRTGGQSSLKDKHVVVVGVGAVGSEIVNGLSKSGIGKLTLIDDDTYTLDNIYRHYLGGRYVFYESDIGLQNPEKVLAMQVDQTSKYPFTKVEMYAEKFRSVFEKGSIDWKKVDLVVCAIGKPNDEMHINQLLHGLPNPPA
ncbi:MAG TPA: ThiF family adenylyltransferase, partial [Chondromyces sp.]|nr:ThiF family adenylyltransferase [Chondromyces sp.]